MKKSFPTSVQLLLMFSVYPAYFSRDHCRLSQVPHKSPFKRIPVARYHIVQMSLLSPNKQCQSTEGKKTSVLTVDKNNSRYTLANKIIFTVCNKQEAQLMLTNPCDAIRDQSRSPNIPGATIPYRYSFLLVCNSKVFSLRRFFPIFDFKNAMTLKCVSKVSQGHWKCHHLIEHIYDFLLMFYGNYGSNSLSRVISELFDFEKCCDLEIRVRGHHVVPFDRLQGTVSY